MSLSIFKTDLYPVKILTIPYKVDKNWPLFSFFSYRTNAPTLFAHFYKLNRIEASSKQQLFKKLLLWRQFNDKLKHKASLFHQTQRAKIGVLKVLLIKVSNLQASLICWLSSHKPSKFFDIYKALKAWYFQPHNVFYFLIWVQLQTWGSL